MDSANFSRRPTHLPAAKSHLSASLRRPKIAFLFLTNSPLHFAPLWERFFANVTPKHYNIYIHADPFVKIPTPEGVFKGKIIPSKRTQRSSPTLISAARRLLATAMLDDPSNAYNARGENVMLPEVHFDEFRVGSQFFVLTRKHALRDPNGCTQYTLTRVNWTDSVNGHPHTYHPPEVSPELIYRLRESNSTYSYMFARKFSPDCLNPLMEIADSVIFKD
ncbi:UNVERIFIED_CONTAM: hypothetical protein Slati_0626500 [Sesamum latifolium]|uniref:Core-2/I-branching beta-1,6-N-acetylglucosaminyltransferase family protein n=1 Tax=Sesamum latifolium TaxID=2727402 RepID=A0AAW2Y2N0_9LAMI